MSICIDDSKVREAARKLFDADTSYGDDEKPSVTVYENAIIRWIELAAEETLNDPEWYAYGPHSNISSTFEKAMDWAQNYAPIGQVPA